MKIKLLLPIAGSKTITKNQSTKGPIQDAVINKKANRLTT